MKALTTNQQNFIQFLVRSGALTFGDFTTKSGRKTPYFINTGKFDDGDKIAALGGFYAQSILDNGLASATVVFGPAYKGIPLCVTTAAALSTTHRRNIGFAFDRKEIKAHGDGGRFVGAPLTAGAKIVLVEDVITAGTTMREIVPLLRSINGTELLGVVIAVDRAERGNGELSAVQETEQQLGVKVFPIVTIEHIVSYLGQPNPSEVVLTEQLKKAISEYRAQYGV